MQFRKLLDWKVFVESKKQVVLLDNELNLESSHTERKKVIEKADARAGKDIQASSPVPSSSDTSEFHELPICTTPDTSFETGLPDIGSNLAQESELKAISTAFLATSNAELVLKSTISSFFLLWPKTVTCVPL